MPEMQKQIDELSFRLSTHTHSEGDLTAPIPRDPVTVLVDATTIAVPAGNRLRPHFRVTLGGNRTLGNPTGAIDGARMVFEVIQDAAGSRTLAYDTKYVFGTSIPTITLTTTANKRDFIGAIYNASTDKFYVVAFSDAY